MSSTNPNPHGDVVGHLAPTPPGAPSHDNHGLSGPPPKEVIERGYEADVYDSRTVLSVPLLVILFFVLAFATVSIVFYLLAYPKPDQRIHPGAAARNNRPLNERLSDNERGPKDGTGQPRPEPLKRLDDRYDPRMITRPPLPVSEGNSPELHPEDLRVSPERFPALYGSGPNKVPLDKTMALDNELLGKLLPARKPPDAPIGSQHVPTAANAGRGAAESVVQMPGTPPPQPPAPAPPDHKGDHK
jgi:hypothetical protein